MCTHTCRGYACIHIQITQIRSCLRAVPNAGKSAARSRRCAGDECLQPLSCLQHLNCLPHHYLVGWIWIWCRCPMAGWMADPIWRKDYEHRSLCDPKQKLTFRVDKPGNRTTHTYHSFPHEIQKLLKREMGLPAASQYRRLVLHVRWWSEKSKQHAKTNKEWEKAMVKIVPHCIPHLKYCIQSRNTISKELEQKQR